MSVPLRPRLYRLTALLGALAVTATLTLTLPATAPAPVGVRITLPAGFNPEGREEPIPAAAPLGTINDNANVSNYLKYTRKAAKLPTTLGSRKWVSRGPFGIDMPPGYSQSGTKFLRLAGMGTAVVADPSDETGNTVYIGNMGGLWRSTDAGKNWTNLTDGKLPRVAIGAIGLDPDRPKDIYIGTGISKLTLSGDANGTGIYVSHDRGRTFVRPKQTTEGYGTNAIAVTPGAVFVATNKGLHRSTDHGASFQRIPLPTGSGGEEAKGVVANWVSDVVAKPDDPNQITVAVGYPQGKAELADGSVGSPGNGLYRSTQGGDAGTFTRMASTSQLRHAASSSDPVGRVELAYGQAPGQQDVLYAALSDAGLAAGRASAGLDVITDATGQTLNPTNTEFNGVYRSGDDGASWTLKATPQSLQTSENSLLALYGPLGYGIGVQGYYNLWLSTDPNVPDQIYLGLEEVFQSTLNAGGTPGLAKFTTIQRYADICGFLSYTQNVTNGVACPNQTPIVGGQSTHPDQHIGVAVDIGGKTRLYTGNDGGFFWQDSHPLQLPNPLQIGFDNANWHAMNTLATTQPWKVALKPDGETIYGMQDNGSGFTTKDNKQSVFTCGGDGLWALPTPDPDVWYCSSQGATLYFTEDHGRNITAIPPSPDGVEFTSPIAMDPTNPRHLVAAATGVMETDKGTDTQVLFDPVTFTEISSEWQEVFNAGDSPNTNPLTGAKYPWRATALAVRGAVVYDGICGACRGSFTPPKLLQAAIATNSKPGCTPRTNSTACWHRAASKGLPRGWVSGIAIDPADTKTIYVGIGQQNLFEYDRSVTGGEKVLVSRNSGESFTGITGNLPRTQVRAIAYRAGQVIVATDVGVFTSPGNGKWRRLGAGLPDGVVVRDLYLDPTGRYLVASLFGRGIWQFDFGRTARGNNDPGPQAPPDDRDDRGLPATGLLGWPTWTGLGLFLAGLAAWRHRRPVTRT